VHGLTGEQYERISNPATGESEQEDGAKRDSAVHWCEFSRGASMASLDRIEGDITEGAGAIIGVLLLVVVVVLFMKWRNLHVPISLYPVSIFSRISTGVDKTMNDAGMYAIGYNGPAGTIAKRVDDFLAGVYGWLTDNTPNPAKSPLWADYVAANSDGSEGQIDAGGN
jgi:hypothetical protein